MNPDAKKLARLHRLERLRAIARRQALAEAGKAEGTLAQLLALAERSEGMHRAYAARADAGDGHALHHQFRFVEGLSRVASGTRGDAERAQAMADARAAEAARAERSRAAVEERARTLARQIARKGTAQPVGSARQPPAEGAGAETGTELD